MKFEGKGQTGRKLAAWLNKVLVGGLAKLITGTHGITVSAKPGGGVTISTNAPQVQWFYLTNEQPGIDGSGDIAFARTGRAVNIGHIDTQTASEAFAEPTSPTADADIFLTFARGWHAKGTTVLCTDVTGRWEIISGGVTTVVGELTDAPGGTAFYTISIGGSGIFGGAVASDLIYYGEETEVVAKNILELDLNIGDLVKASYVDAAGCFIIDGKSCGA